MGTGIGFYLVFGTLKPAVEGIEKCQRNSFSVCYDRQFNSHGLIQKD